MAKLRNHMPANQGLKMICLSLVGSCLKFASYDIEHFNFIKNCHDLLYLS